MEGFTGSNTGDRGDAHVCNCIGCCRECGQCRTNPTHAKTCKQIAALNEQRAEILREARA